MTFSLVARDAPPGAFGMVVSSSSPAVAARCVHLRSGTGGVASQNITNPRLGPIGCSTCSQSGANAETALTKRHSRRRRSRSTASSSSSMRTAAPPCLRRADAGHPRQRAAATAPSPPATCSATTGVVRSLLFGYVSSAAPTFEGRLLAGLLPRPRPPAARQGPCTRRDSRGRGRAAGPSPTCASTGHDDPIGELRRLWTVWEPQKRRLPACAASTRRPPRPTACRGTCEKPRGRGSRRRRVDALTGRSWRCRTGSTPTPRSRWEEQRRAAGWPAVLADAGFTVEQRLSSDCPRRSAPASAPDRCTWRSAPSTTRCPGSGTRAGTTSSPPSRSGRRWRSPRSPTTSASPCRARHPRRGRRRRQDRHARARRVRRRRTRP